MNGNLQWLTDWLQAKCKSTNIVTYYVSYKLLAVLPGI